MLLKNIWVDNEIDVFVLKEIVIVVDIDVDTYKLSNIFYVQNEIEKVAGIVVDTSKIFSIFLFAKLLDFL